MLVMVTNDAGAMIGSYGSGWLIQRYTVNDITDWTNVWYIFAGYALAISVLFALFFRYKHEDVVVGNVLVH